MAHLDTAFKLGSAAAEAAFEKEGFGTLARAGVGAGLGAAGGAAAAGEGNRLLGALGGAAAGAAGGAASTGAGRNAMMAAGRQGANTLQTAPGRIADSAKGLAYDAQMSGGKLMDRLRGMGAQAT